MPSLSDEQLGFLRRHVGPVELPNGTNPVTREDNARLANLSDADLIKADLTRGDMDELFSEDYMLALQKKEFAGEGDPDLKKLMREIAKDKLPRPRMEVMADLAEVVGTPPTADELDVDYGRFLVVRKQQEANEVKKGKEDVPGLNEDMHPDFMASRGQLMFGKVLGDAFEIHEVFASLLSPTGGLVGPGNWLVEDLGIKAGHLDPDNPVALHGTVHDAAGYLQSYHSDGPGYNYRDSSIEVLGTDNPLSGQVSGIHYWVKEVGDEYVDDLSDEAVLKIEKALDGARDEVADTIDDILTDYEQAKKTAGSYASWVPQPFRTVAEGVSDAAVYTTAGVADTVADVVAETGGVVANVAGAATKVAGETATFAMKAVDSATDVVGIGSDAVSSFAETASETTGEIVETLGETAGEMADSVSEAATDVAKTTVDAARDISNTVAKTAMGMASASNPLDTAEALVDGVVDVAGTTAKAAYEVTGDVAEAAFEIGSSAVEGVGEIAGDAFDAGVEVAEAIGTAAGDLKDVAVDVVEDVAEAVVDVAEAVEGALSSVWDAVTEPFDSDSKTTSLPGKVSEKLDAIYSFFWD